MDRLMTAQEVLAVTGYRSRTTLWRKVKAERFPAPIKLGGTAVRWKRGEVEAWIAGEPRRSFRRVAARPTAASPTGMTASALPVKSGPVSFGLSLRLMAMMRAATRGAVGRRLAIFSVMPWSIA